MTEATDLAQDEAVELTSELIRIDTTNTGEPGTTVGERAAAEYVRAKLEEVGYETTYVESGAPGRGNVFARLRGRDSSRGALLVHGHLDVVPADPTEWSVHPFSGAIQDGYIWGRGAVDMKGMVGMTLATARRFMRDGVVPPRDLVFAFLADEEAGGALGSQWLVDNRPELFEGVTEAVGEVGGFSVTLGEDLRAYTIEIAEKGIAWMRLRVRGDADGRVSNGSTIAALGWGEDDRLHMALVGGSVVVHRDPTGAFRLGRKPYLVLPMAVRRRNGMGAGQQVLLAADPNHDVLVVHPESALDIMITTYHASLTTGGDHR